MARIKVNKDKCKGCMLCVAVCPHGLIVKSKELNKRGIYSVEFKAKDNPKEPVLRSRTRKQFGEGGCTGCSMCAIICPDVCIEVYR